MHRPTSRVLIPATAVAAIGAAALVSAGPAQAHPERRHHEARTVYVAAAPGPSARHDRDNDCDSAQFTSIQAAVEAVPLGGTVVVCKGTYPGMVNVDRRITLAGRPGATIDATGMAYGVGVSAAWSTVTGLTVKNASAADGPADGIVTAAIGPNGPVAANHVRIVHNVLTGNKGAGVDLNSSSYSIAYGNVSVENGIGVNVSDDLGAGASHNVIAHNIANRNFGGCGIALADHSGAGVTDNLVIGNVGNDNGLSTPTAPDASAGSGVILASPVPNGVVRNNVITRNTFSGNGHGGVVLHAHQAGTDFSGNVITRNRIGTNNLRTDTADLETTGIYLGSVDPVHVVIAGNTIGPDHYGIFTAGPVSVSGHNRFVHVTVRRGSVPAY